MHATLLPLEEYDLIIVSYSGGKDSLACVLHLLELGVPREKIELWHQCVDGEPGTQGLMDWPCTESYVEATAAALRIRLRWQWKEGGFEREMLRENARTAPTSFQLANGSVKTTGGKGGKEATRRRFPQVSSDLSVRWCSPYLKIDVCAVAINNDPDLSDKRILVVTGERRQEGSIGKDGKPKGRANYAETEPHRSNNNRRRVDSWRAVIDWDESQVWDIIRRWRIRPHPAYLIGWGRVSCMACIFGGADQWAGVRDLDPERFARVAGYEKEFGCTIQRSLTVIEQADKGTSLAADASPELRQLAMSRHYPKERFFLDAGQEWKQPAGAYRRCGGPN